MMTTMEESLAQMALGSSDGDSDDSFPLLDRLREKLPEALQRFVLPALDQNTLALLARTGREWRAAVVSSDLPCAGSRGLPLMVSAFCGSVELLA